MVFFLQNMKDVQCECESLSDDGGFKKTYDEDYKQRQTQNIDIFDVFPN